MLVFRNKVVVAEADLVTGFFKWVGVAYSGHDEVPVSRDGFGSDRAELGQKPVMLKATLAKARLPKRTDDYSKAFFKLLHHLRTQSEFTGVRSGKVTSLNYFDLG